MEIGDFVFYRPATLEEACALGRAHGVHARPLAGGTELLPDLKQHRDQARHVIALSGIPGLDAIRLDGTTLAIGSLVTLSAIAESPVVREHCLALSEAILTMAALQIRNRGTMGGNFCSGVPSADTPPICIAAGAEVRIAGADGLRDLPAEVFFLGPRKVALAPGEIVVEVRIPAQPAGSGASYQRFSLRRATALAVASVAARVELDGATIRAARIVLGAVAPVPMAAAEAARILAGQRPSDELFARAGEAAAAEARPISDLRGSAGFRRELIAVLTRRAVEAAVARARGVASASRKERP